MGKREEAGHPPRWLKQLQGLREQIGEVNITNEVYKDGVYEHREALAEALGHARRMYVTTKGNWKRDEEFIS